uniref:AlNc14C1023G12722 protein n=1 Tax=Albugo laibachii Nc14 TaxID=890382 RepID=F0X2F5_9STRA|nr:AlNc14C1023G12722 [Albugo laibachii Nc14]|eukprot:CCA28048.1 AlNc14C1023G12722 [Albugo laibachii Nc14]
MCMEPVRQHLHLFKKTEGTNPSRLPASKWQHTGWRVSRPLTCSLHKNEKLPLHCLSVFYLKSNFQQQIEYTKSRSRLSGQRTQTVESYIMYSFKP